MCSFVVVCDVAGINMYEVQEDVVVYEYIWKWLQAVYTVM